MESILRGHGGFILLLVGGDLIAAACRKPPNEHVCRGKQTACHLHLPLHKHTPRESLAALFTAVHLACHGTEQPRLSVRVFLPF